MPDLLVTHRREVFEFLAERSDLDIDVAAEDSSESFAWAMPGVS